MTSNQATIIILLLLIVAYVIVFIIGYILGKISVGGVYHSINNDQKIITKSNTSNIVKSSMNKVSIDDTKVVVDIKTDNLEKKYDSLGDIKQSNEDISLSINKLKNMKG